MFARIKTFFSNFLPASLRGNRGVPVLNTHKACCKVPPVAYDYTPKGKIVPFANFNNVYITGPEKASVAIVTVFDIFGFKSQTQQGADILASTLNARVYMPDFFEPDQPYPVDRFPPQTKEDNEEFQKFFAGPANQEKALGKLLEFGKILRDGGVHKQLGTYGLCWGGKVTILSGSGKTPAFDAVAAVHPAMLEAKDADDLSVPLGLFISKDEPKEEYDKMVEKLQHKDFASKVMYKNYETMFHGWAAARADLKDPENKKQYEDVYNRLTEFFTNAFGKEAIQARL